MDEKDEEIFLFFNEPQDGGKTVMKLAILNLDDKQQDLAFNRNDELSSHHSQINIKHSFEITNKDVKDHINQLNKHQLSAQPVPLTQDPQLIKGFESDFTKKKQHIRGESWGFEFKNPPDKGIDEIIGEDDYTLVVSK